MATQLTRKRLRSALESDVPVVQFSERRLIALAALVLVIAYAGLLAATYTAQDREAAAAGRYANARTLLEAPEPPIDALESELASARAERDSANALLAPPFKDPSSDEVTALLVQYAQSSSIRVTAFARLEGREHRTDAAGYHVEAVRMNVAGTTRQIGAFLHELHSDYPGLIPTLTTMTLGASNLAEAEIVFSVYTRVEATPVATGGGR